MLKKTALFHNIAARTSAKKERNRKNEADMKNFYCHKKMCSSDFD